MNRQSNPTHDNQRAARASGAWVLLAFAVVALLILPSCGLSKAMDKGTTGSNSKLSWKVVNASPFDIKSSQSGILKPGQSSSGRSNLSSALFIFEIRAGSSWIFFKQVYINKSTTITIR